MTFSACPSALRLQLIFIIKFSSDVSTHDVVDVDVRASFDEFQFFAVGVASAHTAPVKGLNSKVFVTKNVCSSSRRR